MQASGAEGRGMKSVAGRQAAAAPVISPWSRTAQASIHTWPPILPLVPSLTNPSGTLPPPLQVSPDRVLTISGERKEEKREGSEEEGGTLRVERSFGSFMRRFRLPDNVDVEGEQE